MNKKSLMVGKVLKYVTVYILECVNKVRQQIIEVLKMDPEIYVDDKNGETVNSPWEEVRLSIIIVKLNFSLVWFEDMYYHTINSRYIELG